jgi:hypothetical protein
MLAELGDNHIIDLVPPNIIFPFIIYLPFSYQTDVMVVFWNVSPRETWRENEASRWKFSYDAIRIGNQLPFCRLIAEHLKSGVL